MAVMTPKVSMEFDDTATLFGGEFVRVYRCAGCGQRLQLGQMYCSCGIPIVWEGIQEWDATQKVRRGKKK